MSVKRTVANTRSGGVGVERPSRNSCVSRRRTALCSGSAQLNQSCRPFDLDRRAPRIRSVTYDGLVASLPDGGERASAPGRRPESRARRPPSTSGGTRPPRPGWRCAACTRRTTPARPRSRRRTGSAGARARRGSRGRPSGRGSRAAPSARRPRSAPMGSREPRGRGPSGRRGRARSCARGTWRRTGARSACPPALPRAPRAPSRRRP